jgi:hypothetical protein
MLVSAKSEGQPGEARAFMARAKKMSDAVKKTPSDFLKSVLGRPVAVKLNNGVDYRGAKPRGTAGDPGLVSL